MTDYLPLDIVAIILSKFLHPPELFRFSLVSKTWCAAVQEVFMERAREPRKTILFIKNLFEAQVGQVFFDDWPVHDMLHQPHVMMNIVPLPHIANNQFNLNLEEFNLVGSSTGHLCFNRMWEMIILNPCTLRWVVFPDVREDSSFYHCDTRGIGFGFNLVGRQFKVLMLGEGYSDDKYGSAEFDQAVLVYNFYTRTLDTVPLNLPFHINSTQPGFEFENSICWISDRWIITCGLHEHGVAYFPVPDELSPQDHLGLGLLRGKLALAAWDEGMVKVFFRPNLRDPWKTFFVVMLPPSEPPFYPLGLPTDEPKLMVFRCNYYRYGCANQHSIFNIFGGPFVLSLPPYFCSMSHFRFVGLGN